MHVDTPGFRSKLIHIPPESTYLLATTGPRGVHTAVETRLKRDGSREDFLHVGLGLLDRGILVSQEPKSWSRGEGCGPPKGALLWTCELLGPSRQMQSEEVQCGAQGRSLQGPGLRDEIQEGNSDM